MSAPYGYCQCGCGEKTRIATRAKAENGHIKGQPLRFVNGHNNRGLQQPVEGPPCEIDENGAVRIPLRGRDGTIKAYALVDAEDAYLAQHRWHRFGKGYVGRDLPRQPGAGKKVKILLHREVLGLGHGDALQGDHINGDRLDCRRSNLRPGTQAQNSQNIIRKGGTSRYRGVSWSRNERKWCAQVHQAGRNFHLGWFDDELEAAAVARAWRLANMPFTNEGRSAG